MTPSTSMNTWRPAWAILAAVWRSAPVGFCFALVVMLLVLFFLGVPWRGQLMSHTAVVLLAPTASTPWIVASAAMTAAALSRLSIAASHLRLPGFDGGALRCVWAVWGLSVLLNWLPMLLLTEVRQAAWALPWAMGVCSLAMALGLALIASERGRQMFSYGFLLAVATQIFWWSPGAAWLAACLPDEPSRHLAAAISGGALCWAWCLVVRPLTARVLGVGELGWRFMNAVRHAQLRGLEASAERLRPRDPAMLMTAPALGKPHAGVLEMAYLAGLSFAVARWILPDLSFVTAAVLVSYAVFAGTPFIQGVWISPRLLHLPGGLRRPSVAAATCRGMLRSAGPSLVLRAAVVACALCLARNWSGVVGAGLVALALSPLPLSAMAALAAPVWFRSIGAIRLVPLLAYGLTLALMMGLGLTVFELTLLTSFTDQDPWIWVGACWLVSLTLAALLALPVSRAWARMDWQRMPGSPVQTKDAAWPSSQQIQRP